MTYVIAEPCIDVKDTTCVDVCPVDCIHPTKNNPEVFEKEKMLYIDPRSASTVARVSRSVPSRPFSRRRRSRTSGKSTLRSTPTGFRNSH